MRRLFNMRGAVPVAAVAVLAAACTSVDDELGQGLVPPYQQMELHTDVMHPFETYIATNDTIPVSSTGKVYIGNRIDPVFGKVAAAGMTDFFPLGSWNDDNYFGHMPTADSIYIDMHISKITGDPSVGQTFNIYALRDSLRRDTTYFSGEVVRPLVDMDKPLFSFRLSDSIPEGSLATVRLEPTDEGLEFMQRLARVDSATYADPWPKFHEEFHGFYFAPVPGSPEDAAVYELELRTGSLLVMYFHNQEKEDETKVDTVTRALYTFDDIGWYRDGVVNINVADVEFTYPEDIASHLNDTLSTDMPLEKVYVQGLGGVATYLRVSDELVDFLAGITERDGVKYSEAVISRAKLCLPVDDMTPAALDMAPTRLGMYYTYDQPVFESPFWYYTPVFGPVPMPDYDYPVENNPNSSGTTTIPYGGYLSRSIGTGYYQMVVTKYITQLMLHPDTTPREIWLGPEVNTRASEYSQVVLEGSGGTGASPIRLEVTYTLIK